MDRLNIILYGKRNAGKTTTLFDLAFFLAKCSKITMVSVRTMFRKGKGYHDAHFIIKYNGKKVYIGTGGDTWAISRMNYDFFEHAFQSSLDIYELNSSGIRKLDLSDKKELNKTAKPDVCICACRPDGDRYGAIKSIHSYSEDVLSEYSHQLWIRKEKSSCNVCKSIRNKKTN